jgi:lipopolysaccharide export system protein LptA
VIKYVLTFFALIAATAVMGQQKSVVKIIKSSSVQNDKVNGVEVLKVYNATFQQDYSTLQSDSAYFHQKENKFDAFGHVVITQGDTMHIYSDKLNYDGNTKIAILTDNVKMVDKDATLTTNFLTYNTATRYGTYTGGGKLVNKDNILTSKNGYYFGHTRDSYFRYDVRLLTPDALILTDTMRYNSNTRISYFYGPTNIYGKKKGKDNDTLYTENGTYNTNTEQAFFGKKNLYRSGTKTLTGDSLFYDRKKGFGHAINHIIFNDTEQKMTLKGDLGDYYKPEEKTVVTKNAYAVIVTEEKDTTKNDSLKNKTIPTDTGKKAKADTGKKSKADSAKASVKKPVTNTKATVTKPAPPKNSRPQDRLYPAAQQSVAKTDTSKKNKGKPLSMLKLPLDTTHKTDIMHKTDTTAHKKDTTRMKHDSIFISADTLETRMITYKEQKDMQEKMRLAHIKDTTVHPPSIVYKGPVKYIELSAPKMLLDTSVFHKHIFDGVKTKEYVTAKTDKKGQKGKNAGNKNATENTAANKKPGETEQAPPKKLSKQDSIKQANKVDSVFLVRKVTLADTARVRILSAFHDVKLFKTDLQGKSDSAFYSASDSTIRLYYNPMLWTQGSQLSGDTIDLQMKDKKLHNMELFPNAFIVNIEKGDSAHFNQMAGKRMRGFFKNDKLESMYVDGNAETIYFARDSAKKEVKEMQRSLSSRIHMRFKDGKITTMVFSNKPEHRYAPLSKFSEEDRTLKGFIWKPKDRPVSKEAVIIRKKANKSTTKGKTSSKGKAPVKGKGKLSVKAPPGKLQPAKQDTGMVKKDTTMVKPGNGPVPGIKPDSLQKAQPGKTQDTTKRGRDTTAVKKPVASNIK